VPLFRSRDAGGTLAVLVTHDVTKERTHRRELQAFAGTVAHDLKAPLSGVGSWAEILGDQLDTLDVDVTRPRSSLRRIEASAERMQQLINDLLAYSQAQSAMLRPTSLSLTGLVEDVAREVREASTGAPPLIEHGRLGRIHADRTLVNQLLANVIGNAVKYVAPGTTPHVLIGSQRVGDMLEIRVADNGIGIPRAERGRIFDSFFRASSSGSYPGTGLGLAICARAVERHGGRISARAGLDGAGTTLVFTLPAGLEPGEPDPAQDPAGPSTERAQRPGETTRADPPPRRSGSETAVS
jgi:signal transduction histidine kinase